MQVTETEKPIKVKSVVNEITIFGEININDVLSSEDIIMLKDFIAKRPNGTMDFAILLGYEKDSPEWKRAYTKMNSIIKKLQANSASCKLFFDETVYRLNLE